MAERTADLQRANEQLQLEISVRTEAEEALRRLAAELSLAEERERQRIARELHDGMGQTLALVHMELGTLREPLSATGHSVPLENISALVLQAIQDTRSLIFELSPPILYQLGLEPAVEWLAEETQKKSGLVCEVKDDEQPKPLEEGIRVVLFLAVRELLFNTVKHAQARQAKVTLRRENRHIKILVEDDGVGFDIFTTTSHAFPKDGFGLFSIRQQLDAFGGKIQFDSGPGQGTRVTIMAPLRRE